MGIESMKPVDTTVDTSVKAPETVGTETSRLTSELQTTMYDLSDQPREDREQPKQQTEKITPPPTYKRSLEAEEPSRRVNIDLGPKINN
jgi:hypothetical protein